MTRFQVTFFKDLLSSDGHEIKCPQAAIEINRARDAERAIRAAQLRAARQRGRGDWKDFADYFEVTMQYRAGRMPLPRGG
jgi:hypothetical protein